MAQMVENLLAMKETQVQSPKSGRSPGEGNDNPLQYPCPENPMDRGAGGVAKSETTELLSMYMHTHLIISFEGANTNVNGF